MRFNNHTCSSRKHVVTAFRKAVTSLVQHLFAVLGSCTSVSRQQGKTRYMRHYQFKENLNWGLGSVFNTQRSDFHTMNYKLKPFSFCKHLQNVQLYVVEEILLHVFDLFRLIVATLVAISLVVVRLRHSCISL